MKIKTFEELTEITQKNTALIHAEIETIRNKYSEIFAAMLELDKNVPSAKIWKELMSQRDEEIEELNLLIILLQNNRKAKSQEIINE